MRYGAELKALHACSIGSTCLMCLSFSVIGCACVHACMHVCVCMQVDASEEKPIWSVLREDFMMSATMKDWDKDSDREEADPNTGGGAEEGDSD